MPKPEHNSKQSFQQRIFLLIDEQPSESRIIALHSAILKFAGDLDSGVFLSQIIYWCDKGKAPDGYIYKKYEEWKDETCLSEYAIKKAATKFKKMGILDTKLKKANGSPTVHYKLNRQAFIAAIREFLRLENKKLRNEIEKNVDSLTETTADNSSEITKKHKGAKSKDLCSPCFSFRELTEQYRVDEKKAEAISYYMNKYKEEIGRDHPRLSLEQWGRVTNDLLLCYGDSYDRSFDILTEELEAIIDLHFKTKYQNCDYNILHFVSPGIKVHRQFEIMRGYEGSNI